MRARLHKAAVCLQLGASLADAGKAFLVAVQGEVEGVQAEGSKGRSGAAMSVALVQGCAIALRAPRAQAEAAAGVLLRATAQLRRARKLPVAGVRVAVDAHIDCSNMLL
jgi:hypothetical protein